MTFSPTPEQLAILSAGRTDSGNIMIRALAGTGKTATLELLEKVVPKKPILYLVFNKRNADEAKKRMATTTQVLTFNSIGHRIWGATIGKSLRVESGKVGDILREIINASPRSEQSVLWATYSLVVDGVARAKAIGYVPEGKFPSANHHCSRHDFIRALEEEPDDLTLGLIDEVLFRSIRAAYAGTIDFNDQVYMTALFASQAMFPRYPTVLVDEYQDLNPTNHVIIDRLLRGGGRLIGVGDPNQNIYGFRGAKAGGMATPSPATRCKPSASPCPSAAPAPSSPAFTGTSPSSAPRALAAASTTRRASIPLCFLPTPPSSAATTRRCSPSPSSSSPSAAASASQVATSARAS